MTILRKKERKNLGVTGSLMGVLEQSSETPHDQGNFSLWIGKTKGTDKRDKGGHAGEGEFQAVSQFGGTIMAQKDQKESRLHVEPKERGVLWR